MATLTLSAVNDELKRLGYVEILTRAMLHNQYYFYFAGGTSRYWKENIVDVSNINAFTLEEWIDEYKKLAKNVN